jgi:hypothetical protein
MDARRRLHAVREAETPTTRRFAALAKNIFLLFFKTSCDVASAQRTLEKRF